MVITDLDPTYTPNPVYTPKVKIGDRIEIIDSYGVYTTVINNIILVLNYDMKNIPTYEYINKLGVPTYIYCEIADPYMRKII